MDTKLETRDNFKEAEIGPIPMDWDVVQLGKVASFIMGQSPPSSTYNTDGEGLPFLQGKAEFGETFPTPVKWCSQPQKVVDEGSVLISVRAPVGDVNIAADTYCIGRGLAAINGTESLDNWFLFYLLILVKRRLEDKGTGSTFKSINKGVLESFPIPLPPLDEQRRIAHVLSTIQREIAAQNDLIAAAREVKRSLMQRLFTYGPGPEPAPTKETEIGEIPEHWQMVRLENLIATGFKNGLYKHASFYGGGTPILRIDAFDSGDIIDKQPLKRLRLSEHELKEYALSEGDIVINRVNGNVEILGKCALIGKLTEPIVFESNMIRFAANTNLVSNRFLLHFLCSPKLREQIRLKARRVHQNSINQQDIKSFLVALPKLDEQHQIAHILTAAERKTAAEEHCKAALQELFKSMLHQLMTGQIRLKDVEL